MNANFKKLLLLGLVLSALLATYVIWPIKVGQSVVSGEQQVWSHANNTLKKAKLNSQLFEGIEIDVVYDKETNHLNVRHNVEDPASDLDLFQILDSTQMNGCSYWIDLKNLNQKNAADIASLFNNYLKNSSELKNKMIIESNDAKGLNFLNNNGFFTSWWLPDYPNNTISYVKFFIRTKHVLLRYRFNAISAHQKMLPIISTFYSHNIHLWTHDYSDLSLLKQVQSNLDNPNVHVLLTDYSNPNVILNSK